MISRRKVLKATAIGVAYATLPFEQIRQAVAQSSSTFDYYISPTGDDANPGTLSSPWSITALNAKRTTYAGKRIGLLPGKYQFGTASGVRTTLYSLYQGLPGASASQAAVLALEGGPSSSQLTYLASCDSSGHYSARTAVIDCADPSTAALPTVSGSVLGQYYGGGSNVLAHFGNATIDGIVIRNFTFAALIFQASASIGAYQTNLTIQNCELHNGQNVVSNNNPGAIWVEFGKGVSIKNCNIHDLKTNAPGTSSQMQSCGYIQFHSFATTITNCTFYNCCAISNKDGWQQMDVSYCYCGWGPFGQPYSGNAAYSSLGGTIQNYLTGAGLTANFHHNVVIGPLLAWGESGQANEGTVRIYNNTFFKPAGISGLDRGLCAFSDFYSAVNSGGTGSFEFYNNLVYAADGNYDGLANSNFPGAFTKMGAQTGGVDGKLTNSDYNAYGIGMTFGQGYGTGLYGWAFSKWKTFGYDPHSILLASDPFTGSPVEADYRSFAIGGPATTAGVGGATCGAVDNTGLIGCDFAGTSTPRAPALVIG